LHLAARLHTLEGEHFAAPAKLVAMKTISRWMTLAWLALVGISMTAAQVLAQADEAAEGAKESLSTRYAMAYGLVGLGIILGLTNVVRPGKRKGEKQKPG